MALPLPAALLLCLLLALGGAGCAPKASAAPLVWREGGAGLAYVRAQLPIADEPDAIAVHLVRFDPARFGVVVVQARDLGRPGAGAADFRRAAKAVAAVNGGYFDPQLRPLGLLVSGGRELSRLRHVDQGVFSIADGHADLSHVRQWQPPPHLDFAVECGPRLIVDGKPLTFKPGRARRVAIGRDVEGRVVLAVAEGLVSLTEFTELLVRGIGTGGVGLQAALNLDGGSSTMLDLDRRGLRAHVHSAVDVPIGLAVVER